MGAKWRPYAIGAYRLGSLRGEAVVVWREAGKRRRFRLGVGSEIAGRQALEAFVRARERAVAKELSTIADLFEAYTRDREMDGKSTVNARAWWRSLTPVFGHLHPSDIDKALCHRYRDERLAKGRAVNTVWTEMTQLSAILGWAVRAELIARAPHIWMPAKPPPRDRRLTRDEAARLIDGTVEPHIRLFVILALSTAGRHTAILELTWDRVDFDAGTIDLNDPGRAATSKGRAKVPMAPMARAALQQAYAGRTCDYVIEWASARIQSVRVAFAAAVRRAELEDVTPHVLRHTAASWMAEAGVEMALISQYLGHRRVDTTARIYARYSPKGMERAAAAVHLDLRRSVGGRRV